ncbi:MAG: GyrI-like domain-containing protein [Flavobacteriaceae bacterium]
MIKKVLVSLGILIIAGIVWYLFIKPYDYLVNFEVDSYPGIVNQTIKFWNSEIDSAKITESKDLRHVTQIIKYNDSVHRYEWKIIPINDTTSKVKVYAKDLNHSLANKLEIPFKDTDFEKRTRKSLLDFFNILNEHLGDIKVKIEGESETRSTFCACTSNTTSQFNKATGMMKDYPLLNGVLLDNGVELNGPPILEVVGWNREADSLTFNFCYPIIKSVILPKHPEIHYKHLYAKKAIKAVYNGNYITSDRAWYALYNYARKNDLEVDGLPIEIFYNNPNFGGNAINWKAEVFLPIKEKDE